MTSEQTSELTEAQRNYPRDRKRIKTRKAALFALLRDRKWHTNYECQKVAGVSWHCHVYSLRKEGWIIESRPIRGGVWEYRLNAATSAPAQKEPTLSGPQRDVALAFLHAIKNEWGEDGLDRLLQTLRPSLRAKLPKISSEVLLPR